MSDRPGLTPGQRRTLKLQIAVAALIMAGCVAWFVWVLLTREVSFAGSFGLLGGHWAFAFIMPGLMLSLIAILHAAEMLRRDGRVLPDDDDDRDGNGDHDGDHGGSPDGTEVGERDGDGRHRLGDRADSAGRGSGSAAGGPRNGDGDGDGDGDGGVASGGAGRSRPG